MQYGVFVYKPLDAVHISVIAEVEAEETFFMLRRWYHQRESEYICIDPKQNGCLLWRADDTRVGVASNQLSGGAAGSYITNVCEEMGRWYSPSK